MAKRKKAKRNKTKDKKEVVLTPKEEFAYGHIINALAGGLYPNKFHVVREYIQNGFDAIVNWKGTKKTTDTGITVTVQKPSIFIFDNGTGMDRHTVNEYRKIGFSKKMVGEFAGFRGIGKLAGISVAKRLVVTTSPYGIREKYTLTFDAKGMLEEIDALKKKRENIALNSLIAKHTNLTSDVENKNDRYTMVELQGIRPDSKILFDKNSLIDYLSKNVPVPFNPEFEYADDVEEDIARFVEDYDCVEISVDGDSVYKPFIGELKPPKHVIVRGGTGNGKQLAFCWYCENADKGQIRPIDISGLTYRYKNFAVGDNYLTRKTVWSTSPHLAFYFMGEVYMTDPDVVPTSQRDDFEQSDARDQVYQKAKVIADELNRIARTSSGIRRAEEYVTRGGQIVSKIDKEIKRQEPYLGDLSVEKITQLSNVVNNIEKRKRNIPQEDKKTKSLATRVVKKAKKLLRQFEGLEKAGKKDFDIVKKLALDKQATEVYVTVIRTLKDIFVDSPDDLENIIKALHRNLLRVLSKKTG